MSNNEDGQQPPNDDELYFGREQTKTKHQILRSYLGALAKIVGRSYPSVTYVDAFSGPWGSQADNLKDTSFAIALDELRKARAEVSRTGKSLAVRCYFVERDPGAHAKLAEFVESARDEETVLETHNSDFEAAVPAIKKFVHQSRGFPFIFIDPKGHSGFGIEEIRPLLQLNPGEVLINFMSRHNRRFVASSLKAHEEAFRKLYGSDEARNRVKGLTKEDRTDFLVRWYMKAIKRAGNFDHACTAVVLNPLHDDAHFHLVYATRRLKGIEVFKSAVARAMKDMEAARAAAQQRRREDKSGQWELGFNSKGDASESRYFASLRTRYLGKTKEALIARLSRKRRLHSYDDLCSFALSSPLTFARDFNGWLSEWEMNGQLRILGKDGSRPALKCDEGVMLEWVGSQN